MPKITIELSEAELTRVNDYAKAHGTSTRALGRQLLVSEADREAFLKTAHKYMPGILEITKDLPEGLR